MRHMSANGERNEWVNVRQFPSLLRRPTVHQTGPPVPPNGLQLKEFNQKIQFFYFSNFARIVAINKIISTSHLAEPFVLV